MREDARGCSPKAVPRGGSTKKWLRRAALSVLGPAKQGGEDAKAYFWKWLFIVCLGHQSSDAGDAASVEE